MRRFLSSVLVAYALAAPAHAAPRNTAYPAMETTMPSAMTGAALSAVDFFKQTAPSIYLIVAAKDDDALKHRKDVFEGSAVAITMFRELGPTLTGLMVAGRVGASIAAEIGTMKVGLDWILDAGHFRFHLWPPNAKSAREPLVKLTSAVASASSSPSSLVPPRDRNAPRRLDYGTGREALKC